MPLKRKIIAIGDSKGVTIPKSWLELVEEQTGKPIDYVVMEVNSALVILPLVDGKPFKAAFTEANKKKVEEEEKGNVKGENI